MKKLNIPKELKQALLAKELSTGKKASQSQFIPFKDRLRLLRLEKVHPNVIVNFK